MTSRLPDGRRFGLTVQRLRHPLPFEVRLDTFTAEFHPRTGIAAKYQSDVTIDPETAEESQMLIEMNQPLRRDGYVFFQSSYGPSDAGPNERFYSVFAVVRNPSDQWPKWMTYILAVAMTILFCEQLLKHLLRQSKKTGRDSATATGGEA